ncbi:MAG: Uma2 family endonuclease [Saprospiraceae bacterium]|jgi:Uma2 family endonuclease|nr:Uma2 family endonuclease [Saprospiraceae bacterium]
MPITSLSQLDPQANYTYADYLTWQIQERVELLRGKIRQMAAPNRGHQGISLNLSRMFSTALLKSPCKVYAAPFDVRLTRFSKLKNKEVTTVVQPDLCVICDPEKLDVRGCIGAPDLVVEILSPGNSKTEMKDKFDLYEEAGVREYWLVYPGERSVQIFQLNETGRYIGLRPYVDGDTVTTPIVPGMEVVLADVFDI